MDIDPRRLPRKHHSAPHATLDQIVSSNIESQFAERAMVRVAVECRRGDEQRWAPLGDLCNQGNKEFLASSEQQRREPLVGVPKEACTVSGDAEASECCQCLTTTSPPPASAIGDR